MPPLVNEYAAITKQGLTFAEQKGTFTKLKCSLQKCVIYLKRKCHNYRTKMQPFLKKKCLFTFYKMPPLPGADPGFVVRGGMSRRGVWGPLKVPSWSRVEPW
jgi:hypothetical protein